MAGLHKNFKTSTNETLSTIKERFKIVEGEILAGNNNPEVMSELKELLLKLHHLNAISIYALRKYLKQFN
jgi:septum formation topological specificity factor MinE